MPRAKRTRTRKPTKRKKRRPKAKSARPALDLLVIECDHDKLVRDGLSVAYDADLGIRILDCFFPHGSNRKLKVKTCKVNNREDILGELASVVEEYSKARAVLIVAHSSERGINLASNYPTAWDVAGRYLRPLKPDYIALLACKAGGMLAVRELASEIPSVHEIIASPANATKQLLYYLVTWLVLKVRLLPISNDAKFFSQLALAVLGQNVVFHWRRGEIKKTTFDDIFKSAIVEVGARILVDALR